MRNSVDALSRSERSGRLFDRPREELARARLDAAIGVGNGLILGGVFWFLGYLLFRLIGAAF